MLLLSFVFAFPGELFYLELIVLIAWLLLLEATADKVRRNLVRLVIDTSSVLKCFNISHWSLFVKPFNTSTIISSFHVREKAALDPTPLVNMTVFILSMY